MAKNGTLQSSYRGYTYRMYWSATQSIANNTSTVLIDHWLDCGASWDLYVGSRAINCSVGSDIKSINANAVSTGGGASIKLGTTSHTVRHNDDGSLTVSIKSSYSLQATISGSWVGSIDINGSITLDDIPRKATIKGWPSEWTDGDSPTITYSNPAGDAVDSLQVCVSFDKENAATSYVDLDTVTSSTDVDWTAEDIEILQKAVLNNSVSRTAYFCVRTIIGGETYCDWSNATTLTIANCEPTLSPSASVPQDKNPNTFALTGSDQVVIKNQSVVVVSTGAKAYKHASIKNQSVICGNATLNAGSGTITNPQSSLFKFVASDNRGQTVSKEMLLSFVDYVNLTCSQSVRINVDPISETAAIADLTISGNYFNGSFGVASNTLTLEYRFKEVTDPETPWSTLDKDGWKLVEDTITKSGNSYSTTIEVAGLKNSKQYVFQCRATDAIYTGEGVTTREYPVKTKPAFDWSGSDFNFNVPVSFSGGVYGLTPIDIAEGTDLNDLTTPGIYVCALSSTAQTLGNCPTDVAFLLEVLPNVPATQRITEYKDVSPSLFVRNYYDYKDAWSDWYEYMLHKNKLGTKVDLINQTGEYVIPSDGYLVLRAHYSTNSYVNCTVFGANNISSASFVLTACSTTSNNLKGNPTCALFVRKGMIVRQISTNNGLNNALEFFPLQ